MWPIGPGPVIQPSSQTAVPLTVLAQSGVLIASHRVHACLAHAREAC